MAVLVTKRTWTIDLNDTYILATAIPDSDRPFTVAGALTRVGAYDGSAVLSWRPRGSAGAWKPVAYTVPGTGAIGVAAFGAADAGFRLDATGMELALVTTGRTTGALTLELTDSPEH